MKWTPSHGWLAAHRETMAALREQYKHVRWLDTDTALSENTGEYPATPASNAT